MTSEDFLNTSKDKCFIKGKLIVNNVMSNSLNTDLHATGSLKYQELNNYLAEWLLQHNVIAIENISK